MAIDAFELRDGCPAGYQFQVIGEPDDEPLTPEQLRDAARTSNRVLKDLGPDIQWVQSYVAGDKIYCVYNVPSEALIREHANKSGFPANRITPVAAVIDPTTAAGSR
jgi:hypothetical protein